MLLRLLYGQHSRCLALASLPTAVAGRVTRHRLGRQTVSMTCSVPQVPILAAFRTEEEVAGRAPQERVMACIFKVGDDCRQDVLALQARSRAWSCDRVLSSLQYCKLLTPSMSESW